jgi:hypothetical protein
MPGVVTHLLFATNSWGKTVYSEYLLTGALHPDLLAFAGIPRTESHRLPQGFSTQAIRAGTRIFVFFYGGVQSHRFLDTCFSNLLCASYYLGDVLHWIDGRIGVANLYGVSRDVVPLLLPKVCEVVLELAVTRECPRLLSRYLRCRAEVYSDGQLLGLLAELHGLKVQQVNKLVQKSMSWPSLRKQTAAMMAIEQLRRSHAVALRECLLDIGMDAKKIECIRRRIQMHSLSIIEELNQISKHVPVLSVLDRLISALALARENTWDVVASGEPCACQSELSLPRFCGQGVKQGAPPVGRRVAHRPPG